MSHTIVAVRFASLPGCDRDGPTTPHNVIAKCACGVTATGKTPHTWTVTERNGDRISLSPSFAWMNDPSDPSKGEHLHEFVNQVEYDTGDDW